jgi:two-component system sensor histidine kinase GlrK
MTLYRSTSIRQLILVGFFLVTLPLVAALAAALMSVDKLTGQGRQAIFAATGAVKASQALIADITAMERHARQFQVFKDASFFRVYLERHQDFRGNMQLLLQQDMTAPLHRELNALMAEENSVFLAMREAVDGHARIERVLAEFPALNTRTRELLDESNQLVWYETERMQNAAADTQRMLVWMAVLLIVSALAVAAIFTVLITRPIKQIKRAIRQLGDGEFSAPIEVSGPDDLQNLGSHLEWLRERLNELAQQKLRFMRHISHELKTPLASMREGTGLLAERVVGPLNAEQAEVARILHQNALQLQRLIEDLINFSVAEHPPSETQRAPVPLHRLLKRLMQDQKLAAKAKNIVFDIRLSDAIVSGDAEKLRVIFDNLLSNAIKYTSLNGRIVLTLTQESGHAVIDVLDTGPGIDFDEREKIFDAFYQGRALAKGHIKGSGLGLSIALEYVKLHDGTIEALGAAQGAHLRVVLPLAPDRRRERRVAVEPTQENASAS